MPIAPINPPPLPGQAGRNYINSLLNAINVVDAPYNCVDDLLRGFYTATWTNNTATLTEAYTFSGSITVQNNGTYQGNTVATLTIPGATAATGLGDFEEWVGKPIAINGAGTAGATLVARVTAFSYLPETTGATPTWTLNVAAPTVLTASSQKIACPCFTTGGDGSGLPTCVGRTIVISDALTTSGAAPFIAGNYPRVALIATVASPFSVTLSPQGSQGSANFTSGSKAAFIGTRIRWFTDNVALLTSAGLADKAQGRRALLFTGYTKLSSTGVFGGIGLNAGGSFTAAQAQFSRVMASMDWWTSGKDTETDIISLDSGNSQWLDHSYLRQAIPWDAPAPPSPPDECGGAGSFPCSATVADVPICDTGDSWQQEDPVGTGEGQISTFVRWAHRRSKNRRVREIGRGIGGTLWRDLATTAAIGSGVGLPWNTNPALNWLRDYCLSIPNPFGAGSVAPSLLVIGEGSNDAGILHPNDVWGTLKTIQAATGYNGVAPDALLLTYGPKGDELFAAGAEEQFLGPAEYSAGYVRSAARANGLPLADYASFSQSAIYGWSPDRLVRWVVPPLASGSAGATSGYQFPAGYKCRDFRMVLKLGSGSGQTFWSGIKTLEILLSPKGDNRLVLSTDQTVTGDAGGNLYCYSRAWGGIVATPAQIANGDAVLTTSGQTNAGNGGGPSLVPGPPLWTMAGFSTNPFTAPMVGQCLLSPGIGYQSQDFRTIMLARVNGNIAVGCDANDKSTAVTALWTGGWMFKAQDAQAKADIRITDAGGNTFRSTISAYTNFQAVTLAAVSTLTDPAGASTTMEVGRFTPPAYDSACAAGADASSNTPWLIIEKSGTRVNVSYVLGSATNWSTEPNSAVRNGSQAVWSRDVECFGGAFVPQIWATGGTATITPSWVEIDVRRRTLNRPLLQGREAFGVADTNGDYQTGGDTSHPTRQFIRDVIDTVWRAQNLSLGPIPLTNSGATTPSTGFTYTIPANQSFTDITPAGTLATGTVNLPSVFPQGGRLEIFSSQTITALTMAAPTGFTTAGAAVTTIAANGTIAYRLTGTVFTRVQ